MIGVEDEQYVECLGHRQAHLVFGDRQRIHHVQEVGAVVEIVARVDVSLVHRVLVGPGGDGRHLGDQAHGTDASGLGIQWIEGVRVVGTQRRRRRSQLLHRMRRNRKRFEHYGACPHGAVCGGGPLRRTLRAGQRWVVRLRRAGTQPRGTRSARSTVRSGSPDTEGCLLPR